MYVCGVGWGLGGGGGGGGFAQHECTGRSCIFPNILLIASCQILAGDDVINSMQRLIANFRLRTIYMLHICERRCENLQQRQSGHAGIT